MFNLAQFDPSKLDPKTVMELTALMRELPPTQIFKMQGLMQGMMANPSDPAVVKEMQDFENSLPPGFKEKLVTIVRSTGGAHPSPFETSGPPSTAAPIGTSVFNEPTDTASARLTVLQAVSMGSLSPQEAYDALFPNEQT